MKQKKELEPYDQDFVDLLNEPDFLTQFNCVKVFSKPMRTGKDHSEVNFRIPYLFKHHNLRLMLLTTPDTCIINDWEENIKNMCLDNKLRYETDPHKIIIALKSGKNVVAYVTNMKAYANENFGVLYEYLKGKNLLGFCGLSADEFHTWSLSCAQNALGVKGWAGNPKVQKCVMYNLIMAIAAASPFTFAKTATANREVTGQIDTGDKLKYRLISALIPGEQKQYAHMVGHLGDIVYYSASSSPLDVDKKNLRNRKDAFKYCLERELSLSKAILVKRAILIPCGHDRDDRIFNDPTPEEFLIDYVNPNADLLGGKKNEAIGFVMTSEAAYSFDCTGKIIDEKLNQIQVLNRINDIFDPSILLVVKDMAGRGVSLPPTAAIFFAKQINRVGNDGKGAYIVTEMIEQIFGRAKNVFIGDSQDIFWTKYKGDLRNVKKSVNDIKILNQYNLYMPDNPTMKKSVERHIAYDACTWDMLDWDKKKQADICPLCKRPFLKDDIDDSYIDEHEFCKQEEMFDELAIK